MKPHNRDTKKLRIHLLKFGGMKGVYAAAAAMLALILAPFGLYAALNQGNPILSGLFFAVIAGSMVLILIVS
ncbi:MAG: hypothetical protein ACYDGL_11745 [Bellilinea sp.]